MVNFIIRSLYSVVALFIHLLFNCIIYLVLRYFSLLVYAWVASFRFLLLLLQLLLLLMMMIFLCCFSFLTP